MDDEECSKSDDAGTVGDLVPADGPPPISSKISVPLSESPPAPAPAPAAADLLAAELERRVSGAAAKLQKGELPSDAELNELDRLTKLKALLPESPQGIKKKRVPAVAFVGFAALISVVSAFLRPSSTMVEARIRATRVQVSIIGDRKGLLVPGELGEVLNLASVRISGITSGDKFKPGTSGVLELSAAKEPAALSEQQRSIRLQELKLPEEEPITFSISVAYGTGIRGVALESRSKATATVHLNQVVPTESVSPEPVAQNEKQIDPTVYVLEPIRVSGNDFKVDLYPVDTQRALTVMREVEVASINFESADRPSRSSVLDGTLFVTDATPNSIDVLPGDFVELVPSEEATPRVLVRELTYRDGTIEARISLPKAKILRAGTRSLRNLMPSYLDILRSRWPTQLYATLTGIVAFSLALWRWWRSPS